MPNHVPVLVDQTTPGSETLRKGGEGGHGMTAAALDLLSGQKTSVRATSSGALTVDVHRPSGASYPSQIGRIRPYRAFSAQHPTLAYPIWTAGLLAAAPTLHGPTGGPYTEHSYPFMVATCCDYEGYPHNRHRRLESNLSNANTPAIVKKGYEEGDYIEAGDLIGRELNWELVGFVENNVNNDAFLEAVIEPNPVAGSLAGANRLRLQSGELGLTWSGAVPCVFRAKLVVHSPTSVSAFGEWDVYTAAGPLYRTIKAAVRNTSYGFNFLTTAAKMQLRWRVARIGNLDTYSTADQGSSLKWGADSYAFNPVGF